VRIDFGVLSTQNGRVVKFTEKPTMEYRVSMGVYGLTRDTLARYTPGLPFGFDELVLDLLSRDTPPAEYAFDGYWLDIGRPDDYDRANAEFGVIRDSLFRRV
jgi:mannose-1-phosphate guanylyltransferase